MNASEFRNQQQKEIATFICSQPSLRGAYEYYHLFRHILQGWRFIFGSNRGAQAGYAVNRSFRAGAVVRSLFHGERVFVLDESVAEDMDRFNQATYPVDFSISLDTQALSCIQPFLENRTSKLPKDLEEVFAFLARQEVNCDALLYMLENLRNLRDKSNYDAIYRKLRGYQVLRFIDQAHLESTGQVQATLTEAELNKYAQEMLVVMLRTSSYDPGYRSILRVHSLTYCILIKIVQLHLAHPRQSPTKKLLELLTFMDQKLHCICVSELLLAHRYFSRGQELRFFQRVQIKKKDLLATLDGMAWDLSHARSVFLTVTGDMGTGARYFFPAILTFDKAFSEIIDLYTLRACAIGPGVEDVIPIPAHNLLEIVSRETSQTEIARFEEFFTSSAVQRRANLGNGKNIDLSQVTTDLVTQLSVFCGCDFTDRPQDFF